MGADAGTKKGFPFFNKDALALFNYSEPMRSEIFALISISSFLPDYTLSLVEENLQKV